MSLSKISWRMGIPLMLLVGGLLCRVLYPGNYPFGFDQTQILENAHDIAAGDLTLIGPRTGPANLFTGPLVYYLTAALLPLFGDPYAVVAMSLLIAAVTGISLYLLTLAYFQDKKLSLGLLTLWSLSPFIVSMDRIPWNPNLSILAGSLVALPFIARLKEARDLTTIDVLVISMGVFLGYQAHFSGLLLLPLAMLGWWWLPRKRLSHGLIMITAFFLSLLPTIIFDLRNSFLNARGLLEMLSDQGRVSTQGFTQTLVQNLQTVALLAGRVPLEKNHTLFISLIGVGLVLLFLNLSIWNRTAKGYLLSWLLVPPLLFMFYKASIPEYYFLIQLPIILLVWLSVWHYVSSRLSRPILTGLTVGFVVYLGAISYHFSRQPSFTSIGDLVAATDFAKEAIAKDPSLTLVYDMRPVDTLGYVYLMKQASERPTSPLHTLHFIHPVSAETFTDFEQGRAGVWIDPRTQANANYVIDSGRYILETPSDVTLLRDVSVHSDYQMADVFTAVVAEQTVAQLAIIPREAKEHSSIEKTLVDLCHTSKLFFQENRQLRCSPHYLLSWQALSKSNVDLEDVSLIQEKHLLSEE